MGSRYQEPRERGEDAHYLSSEKASVHSAGTTADDVRGITAPDRLFADLFPTIRDLEHELRKFLFPGSRVEREWVTDRYEAGDDIDDVARDYGLDPAMVRSELDFDPSAVRAAAEAPAETPKVGKAVDLGVSPDIGYGSHGVSGDTPGVAQSHESAPDVGRDADSRPATGNVSPAPGKTDTACGECEGRGWVRKLTGNLNKVRCVACRGTGIAEEDEPVEKIQEAFAKGPHGVTAPPPGSTVIGPLTFSPNTTATTATLMPVGPLTSDVLAKLRVLLTHDARLGNEAGFGCPDCQDTMSGFCDAWGVEYRDLREAYDALTKAADEEKARFGMGIESVHESGDVGWYCVCGEWNRSDELTCSKCRKPSKPAVDAGTTPCEHHSASLAGDLNGTYWVCDGCDLEVRLTKRGLAADSPADGASPLPTPVEEAWGIIANAWGGDWDRAPHEWRQAAERWRDAYVNSGLWDTPADGPFSGPESEVRALHGFLQHIAHTVGLGPDIESYDDVCNAVDRLAGSAPTDELRIVREENKRWSAKAGRYEGCLRVIREAAERSNGTLEATRLIKAVDDILGDRPADGTTAEAQS